MIDPRRFFAVFLRLDRIALALLLALPFLIAIPLGWIWLAEQGLLMGYIVASLGLGALAAALRLGLRWWRSRHPAAAPDLVLEAGADPEWTPREAAAFEAARRLIRSRTAEPVPVAALPALFEEVIRSVAAGSGAQGRDLLDFTVPEALLLADNVLVRFRGDLRRMVPFADTVTVGTLLWLWRQKGWAATTLDAGQKAWRVIRILKNPPAGILREIEGAIAGGNSGYLSAQAVAVLQGLLLEEAAKAAIDLYSGRLRFSDAELLELELAASDRDRARAARPDAPLRIVVAGQVSAGKSSLVNALIGHDAAETDQPPTTDRATAHALVLDGIDCVLIDLPGLDGSAPADAATLAEMEAADLILWVSRLTRPAREIDRRALAAFAARFAALPDRRIPQVLAVATGADQLLPGWPFPENRLPRPALDRVAAAVRAVAGDLGLPAPPVAVSAAAPEWNLDALRQQLSARLGEALMVQRNRVRLQAARRDLRAEVSRAGQGIGTGTATLGARLVRRILGDSDD
ncbi:GTPase [Frigidibacter sp. MR17.14]|uniref:GTPase n=1 Tax=Frigidibacter sp. MR17.14 TaxID=3126509 RepID=UPI0030130A2C